MFRFGIFALITALYCLQPCHHEVQAGNFSDAAGGKYFSLFCFRSVRCKAFQIYDWPGCR